MTPPFKKSNSNSPNCQKLKPGWCKLIAKMPKLTELGFQQSNLDDAMLEELVGGNFQHLYFFTTAVTDAGLKSVARMTQLKSIGMQGPFTDAGLEHLHTAKHLSGITMQLTSVTADGVRKLQLALPKRNIICDLDLKE